MIDLILGVLCEVRAEAHYAEHGGLYADSAWHVAKGERPTCNGAERSAAPVSSPDESNPGSWGRRDKPGFNCSWRGCG